MGCYGTSSKVMSYDLLLWIQSRVMVTIFFTFLGGGGGGGEVRVFWTIRGGCILNNDPLYLFYRNVFLKGFFFYWSAASKKKKNRRRMRKKYLVKNWPKKSGFKLKDIGSSKILAFLPQATLKRLQKIY